MRAASILSGLGGALRGGGVKQTASLSARADLEAFVIEHATPFPYQVDGDYLGETPSLEFRHVPDAVRLVAGFPPTNAGS